MPITAISNSSTNETGSLLNGPRGNLVVADVLLSILALAGNVLVLGALTQTRLTVDGYRRFLLSLTVADIFMASTVTLAFVHQNVINFGDFFAFEQCGNILLRNFTLVSYFASLLSIAGLTIDNFIGIFYQLQYRNWMTSRRLTLFVILIWLLSFLLGFADTLIGLTNFVIVQMFDQTSNLPSTNNEASPSSSPNTASLMNLLLTGNADNGEGDNDDDYSTDYADYVVHVEKSYSPSVTGTGCDDATRKSLQDLIDDVLNLVKRQQQSSRFCRIFSTNSNAGLEKFSVEFFVIGFTIPCFILVLVIYGCIYVRVMRRRPIGALAASNNSLMLMTTAATTNHHSYRRNSFNNRTNNSRIVLTTLMLISSFAFCWMPFILFELFMFVRTKLEQTLNKAGDNGNNNEKGCISSAGALSSSSSSLVDKNETLLTINSIFNSLLMLSPLLNPIIYSARLPRVRCQLLKLITFNFGKRSKTVNYYDIQSLAMRFPGQPRHVIASSLADSPLLLQQQRSSSSV